VDAKIGPEMMSSNRVWNNISIGALLPGLSPKRPGLNPRLILVKFVVDKLALGQDFLYILRIFAVTIIPPMFHTHFIIYKLLLSEIQTGKAW
jgi:hypothetical protein